MKLNRIESAIQTISPRWARNRFADRMRIEAALRAYEAVDPTRLRKKREDSRSPDQITSLAADRLRFQGRYLDENHDVARSVLNTLVGAVVGGGILSFPTVKSTNGEMAEEFNKELQRLWVDWTRRPDTTQTYCWEKAQQLSARSWFRDGEMFNQLLQGNVQGLDYPTEIMFAIELMEADFCPVNLFDDGSTPNVSRDVAPGNRVRQGVEMNTWGKSEAFWFWKNYPTEISTQFSATLITPINSSIALTSQNLNRVDASNILHLKLTDRIRQTRGVSVFSSVYTRLDDLKDYEESERVAARIGAAFAFAITKSIDGAGGTTDVDSSWREMDIAPGIIADNLAPGDKIESLKNERPSNLIKDFRSGQLRSVAGGTSAGYSSVAKDWEGSYSAQRQQLMENHMQYRAIRTNFIADNIDPIYRGFVRMVIAQGLIPTTGIDMKTIFSVAHVGSGVPYIDPDNEVTADEKKVQAGFASQQQIILERGGNPEEVMKQIISERDKADDADLVFSSDAANSLTPVTDSEAPEENGENEGGSETEDERDYQVGHNYEDDHGRIYLMTENGLVISNNDNAAD